MGKDKILLLILATLSFMSLLISAANKNNDVLMVDLVLLVIWGWLYYDSTRKK